MKLFIQYFEQVDCLHLATLKMGRAVIVELIFNLFIFLVELNTGNEHVIHFFWAKTLFEFRVVSYKLKSFNECQAQHTQNGANHFW